MSFVAFTKLLCTFKKKVKTMKMFWKLSVNTSIETVTSLSIIRVCYLYENHDSFKNEFKLKLDNGKKGQYSKTNEMKEFHKYSKYFST